MPQQHQGLRDPHRPLASACFEPLDKSVARAAGIKTVSVSPHVFRHSAAVHMAEAGLSMDEQVQRHGDPKRLSSLKVDHQLEHSRLHDRQIGWLRTLEGAPCIDAGLAIIFTDTRAVAYQTASPHEVRKRVDARYRIACGQVRKLVPPSDEVSIGATTKASTRRSLMVTNALSISRSLPAVTRQMCSKVFRFERIGLVGLGGPRPPQNCSS